jgi:hypothetical protein
MVNLLEGGIYTSATLLSVAVGALGLNALSRLPGLENLKDMTTLTYLTWSALGGLSTLLAIIVYRFPYKERTMPYRQLKGTRPLVLEQGLC